MKYMEYLSNYGHCKQGKSDFFSVVLFVETEALLMETKNKI